MTQPTPADDRSSTASPSENVVFLDSTNSSRVPPETSTINKTNKTASDQADPFKIDGGLTIKTGGMPPLAWQSNASELAQLLVGKQLGSYLITESLGTGGMAAVFKATDTQLERSVALKILPPMLAIQHEQVQRFEREARIAAQLDDEHVARVHQYGQDQGLHFIAYEYVEGTNLKDLLSQQGGRLGIEQAVDFMMQAAQGLAHTAERGIVHRDIKPSNLVITAQGKLKLVDLGLARNSLAEDPEALTRAGATLGTFDYLSPEQAIDPRLADVRSDIYSLGCTFYHALTGVPPVPEGTAARKLHSHQMELPRDPRELNDQISPALFEILCRMLAKKPEDRYQTADDLAADLRKLSGKVIAPVLVSKASVQAESANTTWILTLACLVLLFGMVAGYEYWQTQSPLQQQSAISSLHDKYRELQSDNWLKEMVKEMDRDHGNIPISFEVDTVDDLYLALKKSTGGTLYLKRPVYEISGTGFSIKGGNWFIRPVEGGKTTLRVLEGDRGPMFNVENGLLQLQQLKLELPGNDSTCIASHDGSQVIIQQCELVRLNSISSTSSRQTGDPSPFIRMTGSSSVSAPATVEVRGCIWHPSNGVGIVIDAAGYLNMEDCWVGQQHQLVVMPAISRTNVKRIAVLHHCSIAQSQDSVWRIAGNTPTRLEIDHCLFSRLSNSSGSPGDESAWLVMDENAQIELHSSETVFHRIPVYCMIQRGANSREPAAREWQQLRNLLARFQDDGSSVTSRTPWVESRPWQRYLETQKMTSLSLKSDFSTVGPDALLGQTLRNPATTVRDSTQDVVQKSAARVLIVDGHGDDPGTFSTLNSALGSISDEEETTIQINLKGVIPVKPTEIGNSKIIIKAGEGYRPELAFHRDTIAGPDNEAHLFRVHDGELALENVRVRLESLRDPARALSLFLVTGTGKCRLKDSIVTLKGINDLNASVFSVGDPTGMMNPSANKPPRPGLARLELMDSIVRGNGQVLFVQTSRPFITQLQQAGVALDGMLFTIDGNRSDMAMPNEQAIVSIDRSTCYSTKGLLQMRTSNSMPQIVSLRCSANQSILAVGETQPLVRLDMQQADTELKRKLIWQGKRNCYVSSGSLLAFQQLDQNAMATLYDASQWSELWGSDDEQAQMLRSLPFQGLQRQVPVSEWESSDFAFRLETSGMNMRDIGMPQEGMPRGSGQVP